MGRSKIRKKSVVRVAVRAVPIANKTRAIEVRNQEHDRESVKRRYRTKATITKKIGCSPAKAVLQLGNKAG
jgi:hypothetical protein